MADIELLSKAMESFNEASTVLVKYYAVLEERVKLLTDELDHKNRLLDGILDSIDVGVIYFDRDGVIRLANASAERMVGVEPNSLSGEKRPAGDIGDEFVKPDNAPQFPAMVSRSDMCDAEGNFAGTVIAFKDITRIKELEAENERNRRLTAMGELVTNIAHEIRNPLGSIELFASLISDDLRDSQHGDYAVRIQSSVRSLVNTLDNMLKYSRGVKPVSQMVNLRILFDEVKEQFSEMFLTHGVVMINDISDDLEFSLDANLIKQAIVNIVMNSYQAMPEGGDINISAQVDADNALCLVVSDNGQGMNEETVKKIFEPFYSTKDRGTGLGMSITKAIIEAHGGRIELVSERGNGTTFTILIPQKGI